MGQLVSSSKNDRDWWDIIGNGGAAFSLPYQTGLSFASGHRHQLLQTLAF